MRKWQVMEKHTQHLHTDTAVLGWWKPFQDCIQLRSQARLSSFLGMLLISTLCGAKFSPVLILLITLEKWKGFAVSFKMLYAG